jgi:leucyl aminopeptidase
MTTLEGSIAFFDLDGTLAQLRLSADEESVVEVVPFPDLLALLPPLREEGVRLGLILDEIAVPGALLERSGLASWFDPELIVPGSGNPVRVFARARAVAGRGTPLFVGTSAEARARARFAGFQAVPHPSLALHVLQGEPLRYLRIRVPPATAAADWRESLRALPLVPLHLDHEPLAGVDGPVLFAVSTSTAAARLDDLGFWVDRLGSADLPQDTDLYLLRDDRRARTGFLHEDGNSVQMSRQGGSDGVLCSTHEGLVVAVRGEGGPGEFHFVDAQHGHTRRMGSSGALLATAAAKEQGMVSAALANTAVATLSPAERELLAREVAGPPLLLDVERYAGLRPLTADLTVASRHADHEHNLPVVRTLTADLAALSGELVVTRQKCRHRVFNVEAKLAARVTHTTLPGVVVVGAHLDSTAAGDPLYVSYTHAAPGADDNASGMAGVLAVIRAILGLRALDVTRAHRDIRFVFFNEEEEGIKGSDLYGRELRKVGTRVIGMFQMDMIGSDPGSPRVFELHAGSGANLLVRRDSLALAALVAQMAAQVSPTLLPQVYPATGEGDPGNGRSDHSSFHKHGFAACWATQDFFDGPLASDPPARRNQQYHLPGDVRVDEAYAADIARAIAAAAWCMAVTP